jgi:hypothetical protein
MDMSKYILNDIVEEFFDEDSIEQDIHHHPVSWSLALLCVLPPLVLVLLPDGDFSSLGPLEKVVVLVMETMLDFQFIIAPILCFALAYRRHVAPAVLVAMGSSAILLASGIFMEVSYDAWHRAPTALACLAPFIVVLRKKRSQLNPGRSRQAWATLMAVSILMFATATLVPTVTAEFDETYGWASLGLVALVVGWAWPRGRHLIEEIADDIVDAAT